MINHVILQGVLYINGIEDMRVERRGAADMERRYSGHLTTGSKSENGWHSIRISTEYGAHKIVEQWTSTQHDPSDGLEAVIEGKLMTVFATGVGYVLIEYIRFIGTGDLAMRRGNFPHDQRRRVGAELSGHGQPDSGRPGQVSAGPRRF